MANPEALTPGEWLEAARLWLRDDGDPAGADEGLRLVAVAAAEERKTPGFIGDTRPIRVTVETSGGVTRCVPFFVKAVAQGSSGRARVAITSRAFDKETGLFQRVFPRMQAKGRVPWGPRCFAARFPSLLVMEDLVSEGFRCWDQWMLLDFAHCVKALTTVARFHADSLAFEERESTLGGTPFRLVDHFPTYLEENMFTTAFTSFMGEYFLAGLEDVKHVVGLIPQYKESDRYRDIIKKIGEMPKLVNELVKPSERYRNVLCHGDLWITNFMFKYADREKKSDDAKGAAKEDVKELSKGMAKLIMKGKGDRAKEIAKEAVNEVAEEAEKAVTKNKSKESGSGKMLIVPSDPPLDVRMIDFQTARYCPPALDVMSFIYLSTRRALREARCQDLLDEYYGALRRELDSRGLRVEELVPWSDFAASCEAYAPFGVVLAAPYTITDLLPAEVFAAQAGDYERFFRSPRAPFVDEPFRGDEYFRERVTEVVSDLVDFVLLRP